MIGNKIQPFKIWCQKVLPNVYDDSLSYYEYLCKMNEYLNEVIEQMNTLTEAEEQFQENMTQSWEEYSQNLTNAWNETKNYIDNYFDNLNVQNEINNKLDNMALDGTLSALIEPFVTQQIGGVVANQIGDTVANQIGNTVSQQIGEVVASQVGEPAATATTAWLNTHVDPVGSAVIVDDTLSISGAAADAQKTGDIKISLDDNDEILGTYSGYMHNGYLTENGTYTGSANYHSKTTNKIPCQVGDVFLYKGGVSSAAVSALFYNVSNQIIGYSHDGNGGNYTEITIPTNCTQVVFSSFSAIDNDVKLSVINKNGLIYNQTLRLNELEEYVDKITISLTGNNTTQVTARRGLNVGTYMLILPKLNNENSAFDNYHDSIIEIDLGSKGLYLLKHDLLEYELPYIVFTVTSFNNMVIRIREDVGTVLNFILLNYNSENLLKNTEKSNFNRNNLKIENVKDLKSIGILNYHVPVVDVDNEYIVQNSFGKKTFLFNKDDVNVGDTLYYSITIPKEFYSGYNSYIELIDNSNARISVFGKTSASSTALNYSGQFIVPNDFKEANLFGNCNGAYLDYIGTKALPNILSNTVDNLITEVNEIASSVSLENVERINSIAFGTPNEIFSNDDNTKITDVDDGLLNNVSVIKINEQMYYMYYESMGKNDPLSDGEMRLCFAYSTDGLHFTKGFPQGVTPPISGTNMLFERGTTHGHCVVQVNDNTNPFRMFACSYLGGNIYALCMFKSSNGIDWTYSKTISGGSHDSPVSVIVRGNLLEVFCRTYGPDNYGRAIGVVYCDIDGNKYSPVHRAISLLNADTQLYQASASILDDRRDLLLPTIYNPNTLQETVGCLILDGGHYSQKEIDVSNIITNDVKSIYFASGVVDIGGNIYKYYETRDTDHGHLSLDTTISKIMRVQLIMN